MRTAILALVLATAACVKPPARSPSLAAAAVVPQKASVHVALEGAQIRKDGGMRIPHRGAGSFVVVAKSTLARPLQGDEKLLAVLTDNAEHVRTQFVFDVTGTSAVARIEVPETGSYRLEVWAGTAFLAANVFVAASLPTLDGMRELVLHQDAAPRLEVSPATVVWSHWDSAESDEAFIAEWWHAGKRMQVAAAQRSSFQKETLAVIASATTPDAFRGRPVWRFATERFPLPDSVARTQGTWELRIFRENRAALALTFTVHAKGLVRTTTAGRTPPKDRIELDVTRPTNAPDRKRDLAKLPRTAARDTATGLPVTAAEIRALTRSEILRSQRTQLNTSFDTALLPRMRQLISQAGKPWTDEERPN